MATNVSDDREWTLIGLVGTPATWNDSTALASFDQLLCAAVGVLTCAIARQPAIPAGMAGRLTAGLHQPSSGGLRDLGRYLAEQAALLPAVRGLAGFMLIESADDGWLGKTVILRNRIAHDPASDAIRAELATHLQRAPDLDRIGRIIRTEVDGRVCWVEGEERCPLDPVFIERDGFLSWWSRVDRDTGEATRSDGETLGPTFSAFWRDLRRRDPALEDPTPDDFRAKALDHIVPAAADAPVWWAVGAIRRRGPDRFLVEPDVLDAAIPGCELRLVLDAGDSASPDMGRSLADLLGLAKRPGVAELASLASARSGITMLAIEAENLPSRGFLRLLEWLTDLADIRSKDLPGRLVILVGRPASRLVEDDEILFERLPSGIEQTLRLKPHATHLRLIDFQWLLQRHAPWWNPFARR